MDTSRALSRCLRQLSIYDQSCLRTHTTAAAAHRLRSQRNSTRHPSKHTSSSRAFHTSRISRQDESSSSKPQDAESKPQPQTTQQQTPQQQPESTPSQPPTKRGISLSSILDDPTYTPPSRRTRPQPTSSQNPTDQKSFHERLNAQIDNLVIGERARAARRPSNFDTYGPEGKLFKQTRTPNRPAGSAPSSSALANNVLGLVNGLRDPRDQQYLDEQRDKEKAREQLRLHPSLGKTVDVNDASGFNITRAFITLEARINGRGNSVRKDEKDQKFHIRRGQKKKLKRSERWRIVFKEGFLAECARVRKMIRQGW